MPIPDIADADSYGGAGLLDYAGQAVVDDTTDRGADGVNPLVADVAAMTHTAVRAWAKFTPSGTGTPAIGANDACWDGAKDDGGISLNAAPTALRLSTGAYKITWPVSVYDEVPEGAPGYVGPHTVNLRDAWCPPVLSGGTLYQPVVTSVSGNVVFVSILVGSTLTDPSGPSFSLFAI